MTVTEVSGYARQRGHTEVYRGEEFTIDFITKIRTDILAKDEDYIRDLGEHSEDPLAQTDIYLDRVVQ